MIKVRFHLMPGPHFGKWQVRSGKSTQYYDPAVVDLVLRHCKLVNRRSTAEKILAGANKTVCAWIECESVESLDEKFIHSQFDTELFYNPKILPYWHAKQLTNLDKLECARIFTCGKRLFTFF